MQLIFNGWMICNFTTFSTIFQSYWDNGRVVMKGCLKFTLFTIETFSVTGDHKVSRPVPNPLTY